MEIHSQDIMLTTPKAQQSGPITFHPRSILYYPASNKHHKIWWANEGMKLRRKRNSKGEKVEGYEQVPN